MGSKRKVAMNGNYRFGDELCSGCNASGSVVELKRDRCERCGRPVCGNCASGRRPDGYGGVCRDCAKGRARAHPVGMVRYAYVDGPPAWLERELERRVRRFPERSAE